MRKSDLTLYELGILDAGPEDEFDDITSLAAEVTKAPVALISIVEFERDRQFFKSAHGLPEPFNTTRETPLSHSFCAHVKTSGQPLVVQDARIHPLVKDNGAVKDLNVIAYLGVPICGLDNKPIGALCVIDSEPRKWTEANVESLEKLARFVNDQIKMRALVKEMNQQLKSLTREIDLRNKAETKLKELATTDPLTGVKNRRAFSERVDQELASMQRTQQEAAFVLLDLDHFKVINDEHGHDAGDLVLKAVCERIDTAIRGKIDLLARHGGEEFVILLPNTTSDRAVLVAERCRKAIAATPMTLPDGEAVTITASFGVSQLTPETLNSDLALFQADRALYTAKNLGRNCVIHANEAEEGIIAAE